MYKTVMPTHKRAVMMNTVKLKGGFTLSLKKSEQKVLQVPSAIPIKKAPTKPTTKTPVQTNPSVKRIVTSGGRTITIPPRRPSVNPSTKK